MAPSPGRRGPARARGANTGGSSADSLGSDRAARSLRQLAERAERDRSDLEEQARLLRRADAGDAAAADTLFSENLAMVLRSARAAAAPDGSGLTEDEILQEGSLGLIEAIKRFSESGRDDFRAYAEEAVAAAIERAQAEDVATRAAKAQLVADAEAYERAEVSIRRAKGRDATLAELAEKLEWPPAKTERLGEMIAEARRVHDEELLNYVDPAEIVELDGE